jgi:hypothetical protein
MKSPGTFIRWLFNALLSRLHPARGGCAHCKAAIPPLHKRAGRLSEPRFPVDVVITWVDGDDPDHKAKRNKYAAGRKSGGMERARFRDNSELRFALRSLESFAPWLNTVHLVTDGQHPAWLELTHPRLRLVDHSEFIPAEYLPTFNSHVIEAFLHRIPDLAEHYIYFNDDVFLGRPAWKSEFFTGNGIPLFYLDWRPLRRHGYNRSVSEHATSYHNTLKFLKQRELLQQDNNGFITAHGPYPQTKSNSRDVFSVYREAILKFAGNRFRTCKELAFYCHAAPLWLYLQKRVVPCDERFVYVRNKQIDRNFYYDLLLNSRDTPLSFLFFCINDSGDGSSKLNWHTDLLHTLQRYFPNPSAFEHRA